MNNDFLEIRNAEGMPNLVDATIALDFLLSIKSGIRNCAIVLSEVADPDIRLNLRHQLDDTLDLHAELSQYMLQKGWLHPYDVNEQFQLDNKAAQTALQIANMQLFPTNTNRLGTFATPEK